MKKGRPSEGTPSESRPRTVPQDRCRPAGSGPALASLWFGPLYAPATRPFFNLPCRPDASSGTRPSVLISGKRADLFRCPRTERPSSHSSITHIRQKSNGFFAGISCVPYGQRMSPPEKKGRPALSDRMIGRGRPPSRGRPPLGRGKSAVGVGHPRPMNKRAGRA